MNSHVIRSLNIPCCETQAREHKLFSITSLQLPSKESTCAIATSLGFCVCVDEGESESESLYNQQ
jgi:hypothetical protein